MSNEVQDQLRIFDVAWGDLREVSKREQVQAALDWAWSPQHHSAEPSGETKAILDQALVRAEEKVVEWIGKYCRFRDPWEAFREFQETLGGRDSATLYGLAQFDRKTVNRMPETTSIILKRAEEKRLTADAQRLCPIRRCTLFQYIAVQLAEVSKRLVDGAPRKLCILADSNVVLDLVISTRKNHDEVVSTLQAVSSNQERVQFVVTNGTVAEVRKALNNDLNVLLSIQARVAKADQDEARARGALRDLTYTTREYLLSSRNGGTWSEFADQKMSEALGVVHGPNPPHRWKPEIVPMLEHTRLQGEVAEKSEREWNALVDHIREKSPWAREMRPRQVDEHDIALIKQVLDSENDTPKMIWSNHGELSKLAAYVAEKMNHRLDDRPTPAVTRGHCLFPWALAVGATIDVQQAREAYRQALSPAASDPEADADKIMSVVRELSRIHGTADVVGSSELHEPAAPSALSRQEEPDDVTAESPPDWDTHPQWKGSQTNIPEMPAEWVEPGDSSAWLDVSLEFARSGGGHLVAKPQATTTKRRLPRWDLPVHAATHVDLPWALLESKVSWPHRFPRSSDVQARALRGLMLRPRVMEAIVLDYRSRQQQIERHLNTEDKPARYLKDLDAESLMRLVRELAIDAASIERKLEEIGETGESLRDKCLIIHTGWVNRFMPGNEDLVGMGKEMSAAVLVHPWLTSDAAELLRRTNVACLGMDCHMADNPCYVASGSERPEVAEALDLMRKESTKDDGFTYLSRSQPTHSRLLPRGVLLFELLNIPNRNHLDDCYNGKPAFATHAFVTFLAHALLMDGAICKMLIRKP